MEPSVAWRRPIVWKNQMIQVFVKNIGLLIMSNSDNARGIFKYLVDAVFGDTCFPWYWETYLPYDRPELREPAAGELERAERHNLNGVAIDVRASSTSFRPATPAE